MRILYIGTLLVGGTCLQRMNALKGLGHNIVSIDTTPLHVYTKKNKILYRIKRKLFGPLDTVMANDKIVSQVKQQSFDIVWLDKALTIKTETLHYIKSCQKNCAIVGYSPDDMYQLHNQSQRFLKHLHLYDIFFTTKTYNVQELKELGCCEVKFIGNAFDPEIHRPLKISAKEKIDLGGKVGFIGSYERDRSIILSYLAKEGIPVRIWGNKWNPRKKYHKNMKIEGRGVWSREYAKAICSFDINLCFLRKCNRDLQTTRSVEIPASGGFMLAERTTEHEELFMEGKEAEFFDSPEELLKKIHFYLAHPYERKKIAAQGYKRCLQSGYSNYNRLQLMLEEIRDLK